MTHCREIHACIRCREAKRRCDKVKPICTRCERTGQACIYENRNNADSPSSASGPDGANSPSLSGLATTIPSRDRLVKKRARACLSCTRCHRLKVKCDKSQPCGRCARSGLETTCIYTHRKKPLDKPSPIPRFVLNDENPEFVATWFLRMRGSSHWKALLDRLESLCELDEPPFVMAMRAHIEGDCSSDFALAGNFPFGSVESTRYVSMDMDKIQELLQASCTESDILVDQYLEIYHPSLPVVDPSDFKTKVKNFWLAPQKADTSWLALYLVVLGLGSYASTHNEITAAEFFYASEACLAKTPYMFRPTTTNISTLCLMVLAKQVAYATCWALDTSWNVMGVVVRLSMMMVLHREWMLDFDDPAIAKEKRLRRRLWTIVVYLDIQMSLITGQQSLLPQDALVTTGQMHAPTTLEDCWDSILPQLFPILCHFLARINSYTDQISYDEVTQYDVEIMRLVRGISDLPGNEILRLTLDIFFRRVLLVLHRRNALDINAPYLYPTSYWSSLECSLAMIGHHRNLADPPKHHSGIDLIGRPYMLDFFAAALTTSIHLLRSDAPLTATPTPEGTIPPRQTILSILMTCLQSFSREKSKSQCFRSAYWLLEKIFELLPEV